MAPELFSGPLDSKPSIDIWSMGVVLYTMIYGTLPFSGKTESEIIDSICNKKLVFSADRLVSAEVKSLMTGLLQKDPEKRMKMLEIKYHKWFEIEYTCNIAQIYWKSLIKRTDYRDKKRKPRRK